MAAAYSAHDRPERSALPRGSSNALSVTNSLASNRWNCSNCWCLGLTDESIKFRTPDDLGTQEGGVDFCGASTPKLHQGRGRWPGRRPSGNSRRVWSSRLAFAALRGV